MQAPEGAAPARRPTRYKRRLRSRLILSFLLLGFGLSALFAGATLYLRNRLESQLVEKTLQREVANLVSQIERNPNEAPFFLIQLIMSRKPLPTDSMECAASCRR